MSTVEDFVRPLTPPKTGDPRIDALIERLETRTDDGALAELTATPGAGPALLVRLEQTAARFGDVDNADKAERSVYEQVFAKQQALRPFLQSMAVAAAAHLTPAAEAAMLRLFEDHPWSVVRMEVGTALIDAQPSKATLERMAGAMDDADQKRVWVRDVGTAAAVRLDVATAFDRLHAQFEAELAKPNSYFLRGLFSALLKYGGAPDALDARWFPMLVRFFDHREHVPLSFFLRAYPVPPAIDAVAAFVRAGPSWNASVSFTLQTWGPAAKAAAPSVLLAFERALDEGLADWRATQPLDVLVAMDDPSVLPGLRALAPKAKRKAKSALTEAIAKLARNEPVDASAPPKKQKAPKASTKAIDADPERAALVKVLVDAGLSDARAHELAKIARPRIVIEPTKKASGLGESRTGGIPDLPKGTAWPTLRLTKKAALEQLSQGLEGTAHAIDGKHVVVPLGFAAQLRLEDVAPFDLEGKLPPKGLLSFFVRQDIQPGEHGELFEAASLVIFTEDTKGLVALEPPGDVTKIDRYPARALKVSRELPLPAPAFAYALELLVEESRIYDEVYGKVTGSSSFGMLGYARAAYYKGLPSPKETLLLQLASSNTTGFQWGDASSIFFLIGDAALKRRDFSKAVCVADEC